MNKFAIGDRVRSDNGWSGTVVQTYWNEHAHPQATVDVKWDRSGKSYRPEDGLTKIKGYDPPRLGPNDLKAAIEALGRAWGLDRPLHNSELARALRLQGRDPGQSVQAWLTGVTPVSGPASVAIQMMLAGAEPPDPLDVIVRRAGRKEAGLT